MLEEPVEPVAEIARPPGEDIAVAGQRDGREGTGRDLVDVTAKEHLPRLVCGGRGRRNERRERDEEEGV
jgi:hypothetical protein